MNEPGERLRPSVRSFRSKVEGIRPNRSRTSIELDAPSNGVATSPWSASIRCSACSASPAALRPGRANQRPSAGVVMPVHEPAAFARSVSQRQGSESAELRAG